MDYLIDIASKSGSENSNTENDMDQKKIKNKDMIDNPTALPDTTAPSITDLCAVDPDRGIDQNEYADTTAPSITNPCAVDPDGDINQNEYADNKNVASGLNVNSKNNNKKRSLSPCPSSSSSLTLLPKAQKPSSFCSNRNTKYSFSNTLDMNSSIATTSTQVHTLYHPRLFIGIPTAVGYQIFPTDVPFPVGDLPSGPSIGHLNVNTVNQPPPSLPNFNAQGSSSSNKASFHTEESLLRR